MCNWHWPFDLRLDAFPKHRRCIAIKADRLGVLGTAFSWEHCFQRTTSPEFSLLRRAHDLLSFHQDVSNTPFWIRYAALHYTATSNVAGASRDGMSVKPSNRAIKEFRISPAEPKRGPLATCSVLRVLRCRPKTPGSAIRALRDDCSASPLGSRHNPALLLLRSPPPHRRHRRVRPRLGWSKRRGGERQRRVQAATPGSNCAMHPQALLERRKRGRMGRRGWGRAGRLCGTPEVTVRVLGCPRLRRCLPVPFACESVPSPAPQRNPQVGIVE